MRRLLESDGLWMVKAGNRPSEWEDSFALSESSGRFAVADGASASVRADRWATELTSGFIDDPMDISDEAAFGPWLARRCASFDAEKAVRNEVESTSWYASEVATHDAFATFVGVGVGVGVDGELALTAVAIGDSNLFVIRGDRLVSAWPLTAEADFGRHPDLVSSNAERVDVSVAAAVRWRAPLQLGDTVVLASDALAEWMLRTAPAEPDLCPLVLAMGQDDLCRLVSDLRRAEEIVNDDVTLVRCTVTR